MSVRRLVRHGRVEQRGPFSVIVADPPWLFGDRLPGAGRGASKHYGCLSVPELKAFPLPPITDDALLFLWKVAAMPQEALDVCQAWGFTPKAELVWRKTTATGKPHFGMGRYTRASHETCIIASRGRGLSLVTRHNVRSTFEAQVGRHSEKPDRFYELVREMCAGSTKAELFARRPRPGFTPFGNQVQEPAA